MSLKEMLRQYAQTCTNHDNATVEAVPLEKALKLVDDAAVRFRLRAYRGRRRYWGSPDARAARALLLGDARAVLVGEEKP